MLQRERSAKWYAENKTLANERSRAWYLKHREEVTTKTRADYQALKSDPVRYAAHQEHERQRNKRRNANLTPEQKRRRNQRHIEYCRRKPEANRRSARETHRKARRECLEAYGNKCACCGETTPEFLAIDHVNGGGNRHRQELNKKSLFFFLRAHGYPAGFQVLCHNCNMAKSFYGACPHAHADTTEAPSSMGK